MSLLLAFDTATWLPIIILVVGVVIAFAIVIGLKQSDKKIRKKIFNHTPQSLSVKVNKEYITAKEYAFLNAVYKALPADFIAFPKVALSNLVLPTSDKITFNLVSDKVIDICVFNKDTMEPILAVDLVETEVTSFIFNKLDDFAKQVLKTVKIPLLEVKIQDNYDIFQLRKDLISAMPDRIITMLKQNLTK